MNPAKVNQTNIVTELTPVLVDGLRGLLEGAAEDLQRYAQAIAVDYSAAIIETDPNKRSNMLVELNGQAKLLMEIHRISANNTSWEISAKVIDVAARAAIAALLAV